MVGSGMAGIFYFPFVLETDKVHLLFEAYLCFFGFVILFLAGPCRFATGVRPDFRSRVGWVGSAVHPVPPPLSPPHA